MMKLAQLVSILLALITSLLVSCGAKRSAILHDSYCPLPCWKYITPGVSTEQEVNSILPTIPEVNPDTIRVMSVLNANDSIYFDFTSDVAERGARILFMNGVVAAIDFWPGNGELHFSKALKTFGEPENILALYFEGERIQLATFLLYPTRGIALLNIQVPFKGERARIEPGQRVEAFWYFDPKLFNELMTGGFISDQPMEVIQKGMQAWKGYGGYNFIQTNW